MSYSLSGSGTWPQPSSVSSKLWHWLHPHLLGALGEVFLCPCMDRVWGGVEPFCSMSEWLLYEEEARLGDPRQ